MRLYEIITTVLIALAIMIAWSFADMNGYAADKCSLDRAKRAHCNALWRDLPRNEMKQNCWDLYCDPTPPPPPPPPPPGDKYPVGTTFSYQITGQVDTSHDVDVFIVDLFDTPRSTVSKLKGKGKKVIAYFSAGSYEDWRPDAKQFPESVKGDNNGWPGEKWLDIRQIRELASIMHGRMEMAKDYGYDGVDPDNVDGYANRTGFPLNSGHQIIYNSWLAQTAHDLGLKIGLKNDVYQAVVLVQHFDFAVNEECFSYGECNTLKPFIKANKAVYQVEYFGMYCEQAKDLKFYHERKQLDLDSWRMTCK